MHMSDALVSPLVGAAFWAVSGTALYGSGKGAAREAASGSVPLTGVLGAFIFTVQMINFAIPGTGSSGHLGGGLLLAILLGPQAAFLTLASVLLVQALFFADGGLLALGCNLFNMGFIPAFITFPLIYRPLAARARTAGILLAAVAALGLGAGAVALETRLSGISALPFRTFLAALVPIHLVIGLVEGVATVALVRFLASARPELAEGGPRGGWKAPALVAVLALVTGGGLTWVASRNPDGLEWAILRVAGREPAPAGDPLHRASARAAEAAPLPDYAPKGQAGRAATSRAGLLGGAATLALVALAALGLRALRKTP
ncbi:energy-coupling factor ABC transporter permease [Mesoterricola silvestris]|uniref:Cobalamin biosynthesis protein CbiM n=1 Tax=Mesoterricola silvestris TaxID=2927979 RepID=A0AA48K971_9BACT|nr:energy-coupling factor ABC transporter permease [Mesoterricola silvestris]BDU73116.1 cobalamin biosynthesis protein CbiM [Mesoterricola silvestris]